jgi:hypothetical protein
VKSCSEVIYILGVPHLSQTSSLVAGPARVNHFSTLFTPFLPPNSLHWDARDSGERFPPMPHRTGSRLLAALWLAAAFFAHAACADSLLTVAGAAGVSQLGRSDLAFNFQDGQPGVDGVPFQFTAFGPQGQINAPATFRGDASGITADYSGKFAVTVLWTRGAGAAADRVYADVTIANHLPAPILDYTLSLLKLRFPSPVAANDGNPGLRAYNTGSPGIFIANYAGPRPSSLICDIEGVDASQPLLMKLERGNAADPTGVLTVMNHHDYEDGGSPYLSWPVPPLGTVHFRIALRFAGPVPDPAVACADLFAAFARRYPLMPGILAWKDRRPIAQVFFESDNTNGGRNPRKWFDTDSRVDVTTAAGVKRFQKMVLDRAHIVVASMRQMHAQGVITWDLEGAEFPNATYMGDPTKLATADPAQSVAPEMAAIADQYFKIYRDAGFRIGVTIRPQRVILQRNAAGAVTNAWENEDNWDWKSDPPLDIQAFWLHELEAKIRFARSRWRATLFYIDSNGDPGSPVSFLVMRALAAEFPDVLLIPEQSTLGYYSTTAPYRQLDMLTRTGIVSPLVRLTYPGAFAVINPTIESMTATWPQLVNEVRQGDILFYRAWYDTPEAPAIRKAYAEARRR